MRKSKRYILYDQRTSWEQGLIKVPVRTIIWCLPSGSTSKSITSNHIGMCVYIDNSIRCRGIGARFPKASRINKKAPTDNLYIQALLRDTSVFQAAARGFLATLGQLSGTVERFDKNSGEGSILCSITNLAFPVYACNLSGARTGHAATACVYLNKGTVASFKYDGNFVVAIPATEVLFDEAKWAGLDHESLAFRRDPEGRFINGLFK